MVDLVGGYGGTAGAQGTPDGKIIIYDQRFSNSLWLGDVTGYELFNCTRTGHECTGSFAGEIGDMFDATIVQFGHENSANSLTGAAGAAGTNTHLNGDTVRSTFTNTYANAGSNQLGVPDTSAGTSYFGTNLKVYIKVNHDEDFPLQTSQDTDNYFPVGSTIEVLDTTWVETAPETSVDVTKNVYRSFKVLSHVENTHGHMFAKLDSVPTTDSTQKYALKVTAQNSTVMTRKNIEMNAKQQEVQVIQPIQSNKFVIDDGDTYRIYINAGKGSVEFTEVLSGASSSDQIAEAINSFSALSGPVSVDITKVEIRITFAAIDGDVPQLSVVEVVDAGTATSFAVHTLVEGWSFFAGHSARLENVQPGSVINVTSQEEVTFEITSWADSKYLVFAYDGEVGSTGAAPAGGALAASDVKTAVNSILNEKGLAKFTLVANDVTTSTISKIVIKMPEGIDGSKLELLPASGTTGTTIEKTVKKNNNGRSFKVLRVENYEKLIEANLLLTSANNTELEYSVHDTAPLVVGDEVRFKQSTPGTQCKLTPGSNSASPSAVEYRYITQEAITASGGAGDKTVYTVNAALEVVAGNYVITDCDIKVLRTTIVVDSMPDTMSITEDGAFGANVNLHVYGPKGSCSVSEIVKGTYESDVCSSRGNCDGASGLCVCHEGYSGEACETQTVLV
jgi:glycerol-3-phosphate responsive antiterminator